VLLYSSICLSAYIFAFDLSPWLHALFDCLHRVDGRDAPALLGDSLCDHIAAGDGDRGAHLGRSTEEYPARPCRICHRRSDWTVARVLGAPAAAIGNISGLLSCKPQYGVLVPLAFLVSRNWRAFASATATSIVLGVVAGIAFGFRGWPAFIEALFDRNAGLSRTVGWNSRSSPSIVSSIGWAELCGCHGRSTWPLPPLLSWRMRNLGQAAFLIR